jgi:hypothetical protein
MTACHVCHPERSEGSSRGTGFTPLSEMPGAFRRETGRRPAILRTRQVPPFQTPAGKTGLRPSIRLSARLSAARLTRPHADPVTLNSAIASNHLRNQASPMGFASPDHSGFALVGVIQCSALRRLGSHATAAMPKIQSSLVVPEDSILSTGQSSIFARARHYEAGYSLFSIRMCLHGIMPLEAAEPCCMEYLYFGGARRQQQLQAPQ